MALKGSDNFFRSLVEVIWYFNLSLETSGFSWLVISFVRQQIEVGLAGFRNDYSFSGPYFFAQFGQLGFCLMHIDFHGTLTQVS